MNNKNIALIVGVLSLGTLATRAQTTSASASTAPVATVPAPTLDVTLTPSYVSTYMFRGQRLSGQAFQPEVDATYGGLDVGVWSSMPISKSQKVEGQSDPEIDPYASYTYNLSEAISIQPGFTWYTYPTTPTKEGFYKATFEPNLALNYTLYGVKLTPEVFYDVILRGLTGQVAATYSVPVKDLASSLNFSASGGVFTDYNAVNHTPQNVQQGGKYWSAGVSMPFTVTKNSTLTFGWLYTKGYNGYYKEGGYAAFANPLTTGRGVFSASYAWSF
jgi:uncharacterized protein (TIGR02001 family)